MQPRHVLTAEGKILARAQAGVLSTAQLRALGFTYRSLDRAARDWTRLARGVYLLTDAVEEAPWAALVWAGVLSGGAGAGAAAPWPTAAVFHGLLSLNSQQARAICPWWRCERTPRSMSSPRPAGRSKAGVRLHGGRIGRAPARPTE